MDLKQKIISYLKKLNFDIDNIEYILTSTEKEVMDIVNIGGDLIYFVKLKHKRMSGTFQFYEDSLTNYDVFLKSPELFNYLRTIKMLS